MANFKHHQSAEFSGGKHSGYTAEGGLYSALSAISPEYCSSYLQRVSICCQPVMIKSASHAQGGPSHCDRESAGGRYKRLNLATKQDTYTPFNIQDLSSKLHICKIFSRLGLRKGKFQNWRRRATSIRQWKTSFAECGNSVVCH
jgi:hypothetical protein